jgi:glycosyltransferase involved in cell wall biosynthesis
MDYRHTNLLECYTAAKILSDLGYNVDVVDCNNSGSIDFEKYDVIYGMGKVLEKVFYSARKENVCTIFYGTGLNPIAWNIKTTLRMREFEQRHGKIIWKSSRMIPHPVHSQVLLSNAVIALGDSNNFSEYLDFDPSAPNRYHQISSFYYDSYDIDLNRKDFAVAKKNFLWFGSAGAIHKGLDVLLDIFSRKSDLNLHICGVSPSEKEFLCYYSHLLSGRANIINHGFLNLQSQEFRGIMEQCGYVVFPSCAEGGSPSVLNCAANGGLVPIISKDSGLDIEEYGWIIDSPDIRLFSEAIDQAQSIADVDLMNRAQGVKEFVRRTYTFDNYERRLKNILSNILEGHNRQTR